MCTGGMAPVKPATDHAAPCKAILSGGPRCSALHSRVDMFKLTLKIYPCSLYPYRLCLISTMPNSTSMLVLSEEHFTTLEGYLDEYKSAKKKERKALTDIIATELGGTIPSIAPLNLANFRKVRLQYVNQITRLLRVFLLKQIHEWFVDRLRKKKKPLVKYSAKWTAKMVFTREYSEEVEKRNIEASKAPPGKPDYLATLQTTVKRLWNEQTPEEQERMKQLAEQYNEAGMPRELQLR